MPIIENIGNVTAKNYQPLEEKSMLNEIANPKYHLVPRSRQNLLRLRRTEDLLNSLNELPATYPLPTLTHEQFEAWKKQHHNYPKRSFKYFILNLLP